MRQIVKLAVEHIRSTPDCQARPRLAARARGRRLRRRGRNKAAVAVARKLAAAVWHVLSGHVIGALEPTARLRTKLFKLATEIGIPAIKAAGFESKETFIERKLYLLKNYP